MKVHFYLRYSTKFGENLTIIIERNGQVQHYPMQYVNQEFWHLVLELDDKKATLQYRYELQRREQLPVDDWEWARAIDLAQHPKGDVLLVDTWSDGSAYEHAFATQPFRDIFFKKTDTTTVKQPAKFTHEFRAKAPLLRTGERLCLLGSGHGLHDWSGSQPLLMNREGDWWVGRTDLGSDDFPVAYKYGVWNDLEKRFVRFEGGDNRALYFASEKGQTVVVHDGFVRMPNDQFKGAGVAIPVFSLRSNQSYGTGEFTDLKLLADWASSVGMKMIQLLPVNDTSATGTFTDSYPYAAVSAFALHPLYLNVGQVAGKANAALLKEFNKKQAALNALDTVDYVAVMAEKQTAMRALYAKLGEKTLADKAFLAYFEENKHWLMPYAVFSWLKEQNGTSDFTQWKKYGVFVQKEIEALTAKGAKSLPDIAFHYFVQWHLHLQLKEATDYAHAKGLALKGDIPIGIYRYSCDAWVAPELYNMGRQSGAPPDDFAASGQNWGFPTYNWERMKADGFAWWRQRFEQMSLYFDAFRIDHILGFFRIWSIPLDAVEGILGRFVPAIPMREQEFWQAGIGFNKERLCDPYISERVLWEIFDEDAALAREFLQIKQGTNRYELKPAFGTQRKVEAHFATLPATETNTRLRDGLYRLLANVILLEDEGGNYHFRIAIDKCSSFNHLDDDIKARLHALYVNYFFRRQDAFWQREAMEKLPALKRSTQMLICGEDLGMVPDCVPDVMRDLGILSLEIQRMPKQPGTAFFHPKDAPYLAVVTPSTHDMSTIRGWWEEDRALSQRFYNDMLERTGDAPYFCEPWINRSIVEQHFYAPAMWSIFQLQDLMGIDGDLRRDNPEDERINVPANPKHYWRYRMHLSLEALQQKAGFNGDVAEMIRLSGRG
jgi:4-alpha-glucanotransferase